MQEKKIQQKMKKKFEREKFFFFFFGYGNHMYIMEESNKFIVRE